MIYKKQIIALIVFVSILSCAQNTKKNDSLELLEHLEHLSSDEFQGRQTGTNGSLKARQYIIEQFQAYEVPAFNISYEQGFKISHKGKGLIATNVLAKLKGTDFPDKYIVVSAHYDHLGISKDSIVFNGADDNASGVAALFSIAKTFKKNRPKHSIIFAAFDAEEIGLLGAKHFSKSVDPSNIVANINLDMIGRSSKNEIYVVGSRYTNTLKKIVQNFKNPTETKISIGHDGTDTKEDWTYASDHAIFHQLNIPFLYFGNEDHASYHKTTDEFKFITKTFYLNTVNIIKSIIRDIDNTDL